MTPSYVPLTRAMKRAIIHQNLQICKALVRFLKQHPDTSESLKTFPWQNIGYSSTRSCCSGGGVGSANAHCHLSCDATPVPRICIKQRLLTVPFGFSTRGQIRYSAPKKIVEKVESNRIAIVQNNPLLKKYRNYRFWVGGGVPLSGPWALVDVIIHELAHHIDAISGEPGDLIDSYKHGPRFYSCYQKLHQVIVDALKSRDPNLPAELTSALWGRL